jgi:hypothetical protein
MFFRIYLPSLMGCGRPAHVDSRRSPRRRWVQIGSHEPTLKGSFAGNRLSRGHQEQLHADQASSPSGVLAAKLYGGLHHLGGRREGGRAVAVVWRDAVATAEPKPLEETANGGARQAQGRDDLTGPAALLPEPEHRLTERDRDGTSHGQTSQKYDHESNRPILHQCGDAIKPGVGISRSNLVSRDIASTTSRGQRARVVTVPARDTAAVLRQIASAKRRFGLPESAVVFSCYEAGRDGFWLYRFLHEHRINNEIVDSSSIKVNRRARCAKANGLDAVSLVGLLVRYREGESTVWSTFTIPDPAADDRRHLHRRPRRNDRNQAWVQAITADPPASRVTRTATADPSRIEPNPRVSEGGPSLRPG